jgi:hypothetical protein
MRKSVRHANTRIVYPKEDPIIHSAPSRPATKHTSLLFELKPVAIRAAATTRATMALTMVEETFVILIISSCVNGMFVKFGYKLRRVRVSNSKSVRKIFRQDIIGTYCSHVPVTSIQRYGDPGWVLNVFFFRSVRRLSLQD